ncbi:MAG: hypothetical protein GXC94_13180 [Comamonadaceae bacterium]|nr:hypothetical protein [Comamonadaceae bacterium]
MRYIEGKFVEHDEAEHRERYDACSNMVEQLVEYSHRKRVQLAHLSLVEYMRRLREAVVRKGWDVAPEELTWVMQRVTIALGGDALDVPQQETLAVVQDVQAQTVAMPVETLVDQVRARLEAQHRKPD